MAQIFISYKRVDKDKVFPIVAKIEQELGCKCWVDLDAIESSVQFASVICRAIDDAEVVLFMHSSAHLNIDFETDWTVKELNYAQLKKKRVILVKLDTAPLDNIFLLEYGSKNNIDSLDPDQFKKLFHDLRSWLSAQSSSKSEAAVDPLCPCGSGKLFKNCHGKSVVSTEKTWKIGDFYNVDGKKGVVFWVDESGNHGKIVSMDQANLQWYTNDEYIDRSSSIANSRLDGMKNLQSIMNKTDWRERYPAFAWCADHGSDWYLPAVEELKELLLNDEIIDKVNKHLNGRNAIYSKGNVACYWSSTEEDNWWVLCVDVSGGYTYGNSGFTSYYVRAVSSF